MKTLKDKIFEANESKDKTFKQIRKGDTIYYLDVYNSDRNHKIEVCTVDGVYYHEPMTISGYTTSEAWEIKFTRKNKNKNGTCYIYKKDIEKKLYIDVCGFGNDTIFHYVATDRELLNDFQENLVDNDIVLPYISDKILECFSFILFNEYLIIFSSKSITSS